MTKQIMTSKEIAELTGKEHAHVMRDIRNLQEQVGTESIFGLSDYKDTTGRVLPMYALDKKQTLFLVSGYNALLRLKIINRWEELELAAQMTTPVFELPTRRELAYMVIEAENKIEQLEKELTIAAPKVEYTEKVLTSLSGIRTTQIAKELGMSAQKLNLSLKTHGVQYKRNSQWVLTAKYQGSNFTDTVTVPVVNKTGQTITSHLTVWTEQGRRFIHSLFNGNLLMQNSLFSDDDVADKN